MDYTERHWGPVERNFGEGSIAFALFSLSHAECGSGPAEVTEVRLDEHTVACWCPECDDAWIFG